MAKDQTVYVTSSETSDMTQSKQVTSGPRVSKPHNVTFSEKSHETSFGNVTTASTSGVIKTRRCIVALDGRDDADSVLFWFSQHIYRAGDEAVLVYVPEGHGLLHASKWEKAVYSLNRDVTTEVSPDEKKEIVPKLHRFARKLQKLQMEGKVRLVVAKNPAEGILRAAEEEGAELIVVGSGRRGTWHRKWTGSVSHYLINHAPCPVLVCSPRGQNKPKRSWSFLSCTSTG